MHTTLILFEILFLSFMYRKKKFGPCEYNSVDKNNVLLYAVVRVWTPDTSLIHLKNWIIIIKLLLKKKGDLW